MLTILCALAIQQQTITFTHPCAHSSVVLEKLGEATGETIKPSGTVVYDYFLVRFEDLPVRTVYDRIAEVLNATWTLKDGVRYLGRTKQQEEAGLIAARKELARAAQEYIDNDAYKITTWSKDRAMNKVRPMLQQNGDLDRTAASDMLRKDGPCRELADEFVRAVGAERLASLSFEDRTTFRWSPGKNEERIPVALRSKAEAMIRNINLFGEGMRALGVPQLGDYDLPAEVRLGSAKGLTPDTFAFQVYASPGSISVTLIANGRSPMPYVDVYIRVGGTEREDAEIPELEGTFQPSPLARAYCDRAVKGEQQQTARIDPESEEGRLLLPYFQTGMAPDPTQLGTGELIQSLAEALDYNVVAVVQDWSAFSGYNVFSLKDKPMSEIAEFAQSRLGVRFDTEAKWLTLTAPSIYGKTGPWNTAARIDRKAIAQLALDVYKEGWPRIDALAEYASHCTDSLQWSVGHRLSSVLQPTSNRWTWQASEGTLASLTLYHSLPSAAKQLAKNDWLSMSVQDLPSGVRQRLVDAIESRGFAEVGPQYREMQWGGLPMGAMSGDVMPTRAQVESGVLEVRVENRDFLTAPNRSEGSRNYSAGLMEASDAARRIVYQRENGINGVDYSNMGSVQAERLLLRLRTSSGQTYQFIASTSSTNSETQFVPSSALQGELGDKLREELRKLGG